MKSVNPILKKASLFGIFFTFIIGSILHFVYPLTGYNTFIGYFVPVSESVWEHLKLSFIAWIIYGLACWSLLSYQVHNYWLGIFLASFTGNLFIILFFYSYTAIIGHSILAFDIFSFLAACMIGAYAFYKTMNCRKLDPNHAAGSLLILCMLLAFAYFSYHPAHLPIFVDPTLPSAEALPHLEKI